MAMFGSDWGDNNNDINKPIKLVKKIVKTKLIKKSPIEDWLDKRYNTKK